MVGSLEVDVLAFLEAVVDHREGDFYLYALAAGGQAGVERALRNLHAEIERDMKLMGCGPLAQLNRDNLRFR